MLLFRIEEKFLTTSVISNTYIALDKFLLIAGPMARPRTVRPWSGKAMR